ncbi:MAG TPA: MurR/RpiR family transcriptional regulator [Terriglobia bacterium]|nr:MurR/RpiR family transcriptional regulator [Terriglobia bacterium]
MNRNGKTRSSRQHLPLGQAFDVLVGKLSPKRQEVIRPVLEQPREFVLESLRGLSRRLQLDPSTMVRIVRGMGFGSYSEFRQYLHELSIVLATPLDLMQTGGPNSDIPTHLRSSLDLDLKNLQSLGHSLDFRRIVRLAQRLYQARRILLLGGDMASTLVGFLEWNLTILGLPVSSAISPGSTAHRVQVVGRLDVVLAISFRRGLRQTVEGLQEARQRGAYCVAISDTYLSPLRRFAHECFNASVESPSFAGSYVAPMALLNLIIVATANYRRARAIALLKAADEEQRHGYRWFRDA